jgi:hypothetical protein
MRILAGIFYKLRNADCGLRICRGYHPTKSAIRNPQSTIILVSTLLIICLSACGKIGDPLPPIPRAPLIVDELSVTQEGTQLILHFPIVRSPRSPRLQRIDIYRVIESINDPLGVTQQQFSTNATIIDSILGEDVPTEKSVITKSDNLDLKNGSQDLRYRYAVRLVTASGIAADFSNFALIIPLFDLASPPSGLKAKQREREIEISWNAPKTNENGTTPANAVAYNIYRSVDNGLPVKLNDEPLKELRFIDNRFEFGKKYEYVLRALSTLPDDTSLKNAVESNLSAPLKLVPEDTFPPSAPSPITIASIGGLVSLYWPLNPEPDVVGYNIYRCMVENSPMEKWTKLNTPLHKTASFRDDKVEVGKEYFYQITAVDAYGNESVRSETKSEIVNP